MSTRTEARSPRGRDERPQTAADGRSCATARGHGKKAEAVRERAVVALITEKSIGAAARRCLVGERTLRRWMTEDEAFKRELAGARQAMFQAGMNRVQAMTAVAIDTLAARLRPSTQELKAEIRKMSTEELYQRMIDLARKAGGLDALHSQAGLDPERCPTMIKELRERWARLGEP